MNNIERVFLWLTVVLSAVTAISTTLVDYHQSQAIARLSSHEIVLTPTGELHKPLKYIKPKR